MDNAGALLAGLLVTYLLVLVIWYIVLVIANWKIFTKAGEAGWKSLIPFYSNYIMFKISWKGIMFWVMMAGSIIGVILSSFDNTTLAAIGGVVSFVFSLLNIVNLHMMSRAFGHGIGFTLGLIFLNPIFMLVLGFGSSEYEGPQNL